MEKATTFNKDIIQQINNIYKSVLESPYSDFYRNKYRDLGMKEIRTYEDFQRIPFLTKNEILAVPIEKRIFVKKEGVNYYAFTSGTTNSAIPTIMPRTFSQDFFSCKYGPYKIKEIESLDNSATLMLLPTLVIAEQLQRISGGSTNKVVPIAGDIHNLKLMAKITKELKIQAIVTIPSILDLFINELDEIKYDLTRIKLLLLRGELCSAQKARYFKSKMPNASIYFHYGSMESGSSAHQCDYLSQNILPSLLHPVPFVLFEIVDSNNKTAFLGEAGEIIYTDLENGKAFPLIRYKTKDIASLIKEKCRCGEDYSLSIEGRAEFDVFKFYGTIIYTQMIESSLDPVRKCIETRFQMHVHEEKVDEKLKPKLTLHLKLKKEFIKSENLPNFKKEMEEKISNNLRLSANSTLKQLVEKNIFLPLEIVFVKSWPENEVKTKNIISHLE